MANILNSGTDLEGKHGGRQYVDNAVLLINVQIILTRGQRENGAEDQNLLRKIETKKWAEIKIILYFFASNFVKMCFSGSSKKKAKIPVFCTVFLQPTGK